MHHHLDTAPKQQSSLPTFLDQKDSFQRVCALFGVQVRVVQVMVQVRVVHLSGGQYILEDQKNTRCEQLWFYGACAWSGVLQLFLVYLCSQG